MKPKDHQFIPSQYRPGSQPSIKSIDDVIKLEKNAPFIKTLAEFELAHGLPFEQIPYEFRQPLILGRLNELVQIMKVNPVWRKRLHQSDTGQVCNFEEWQNIPISTRADLQSGYTDSKDLLVIPWQYGGHKSVASGGSSGEPIVTIYRESEFSDIGHRAGPFWRRNIFKSDPVTLMNLFGTHNGWAGHELVRSILEGIPASNILPVGTITIPRVADFWVNQGVTDIAANPSVYSNLTKMLKELDPNRKYDQVKRAFYGGEFMNPLIAAKIKEAFPNSDLYSAYSSTQANSMAIQINPGDESMQIMDDINYLEIVDDNDKPLPFGKTGRLLVTRLLGNGDQPLRLDLQDKASIDLPDPTDPVQSPKLKLFGRTGDYFRLCLYDMKPDELMKSIYEVLGSSMSLESIETGQLILNDAGLHLLLASSNSRQVDLLDAQQQFQILYQSIRKTVGFFEENKDLQDWVPGTDLTIRSCNLQQLVTTPAGKIPTLVNQRKAGK